MQQGRDVHLTSVLWGEIDVRVGLALPGVFLCLFVPNSVGFVFSLFGLWWLCVSDLCYAVTFHGPSRLFQTWHAILRAQPLSEKRCEMIWKRFWNDSVTSFTVAFRPIFSSWILGLKMFEDGSWFMMDLTGHTCDWSHDVQFEDDLKTFSRLYALHFTCPASANVRSCACISKYLYIYGHLATSPRTYIYICKGKYV